MKKWVQKVDKTILVNNFSHLYFWNIQLYSGFFQSWRTIFSQTKYKGIEKIRALFIRSTKQRGDTTEVRAYHRHTVGKIMELRIRVVTKECRCTDARTKCAYTTHVYTHDITSFRARKVYAWNTRIARAVQVHEKGYPSYYHTQKIQMRTTMHTIFSSHEKMSTKNILVLSFCLEKIKMRK
jgi:hypothetical protein